MVLETMLSTKAIRARPLYMLVLSAIISTICVFVSYFIFPAYAGIITPLLVTIVMTPFFYKIFKEEEREEVQQAEHKIHMSLFSRRADVIFLFSLFFIGNFISIFLIALAFPQSFVTQIFSQQLSEITALSGAAVVPASLNAILFNNLRVMGFAFILSILFCTGAILILSWNASILAIYLASFIKKGLISQFLFQTIGIFPHTFIEILAYFLAGIAGGILSVGLIREKIKSKEFKLVLFDSLILFGFGIAAVICGAIIEVL